MLSLWKRIAAGCLSALLAVLLLLLPCACGGGELTAVYLGGGGAQLFESKKDDVQIYFFDIDNCISEDGQSWQRPYHQYYASHSSDCFVIKVGDTEILVDGGHQTPKVSSDYISKEDGYIATILKRNILPKLAQICTDGVLEYAIVTHGDYDHIAMLAADGGLFDAFSDWEKYRDKYLKDEAAFAGINFSRIERVIDFDSPILEEHSDPQDPNPLVSSDAFNKYRTKRDAVIKKAATTYENAVHLPAAALFQSLFEKDEDGEFVMDDGYFKDPECKSFCKPDYFEKNPIPVYLPRTSVDEKEIAKLSGKLNTNGKASFFEIDLGGKTCLRILYNYFYDHLRHHSFDSQDKNNLSVCIEVVSGHFKFLSLGDLGGYGEDALIKYYAGTNVLKNVTLLKASHHGSTTNGESIDYIWNKGKSNESHKESLLKVATPRFIVITGVAQIKCVGDPLYNNIVSGAVFLDKPLFDAIGQYCPDAKVYITNVVSKKCSFIGSNSECSNGIDHFVDAPFYGDIYFGYGRGNINYGYSYIGEVNYYLLRHTEGTLSTVAEGKSVSLLETEWYREASEILAKNNNINQ